jgi:arylsulfatase A-like enzyme
MPERLNFLCFVADQMRADHMRCAGNPVIQTPNLDRLAAWPGISFAAQLRGHAESLQDSVIVENDEDYLGLRLRTLVTERYKITAYPGQEYGELFDVREDQDELHNLWREPAHEGVKKDLLIRLMERLVATDNRLPRRVCHA